MSHTPVATPVVPAPKTHPRTARAEDEQTVPFLVPPVSVVTPTGDLELVRGSLVVGRLPDCTICLGDQLVSRMHARIGVHGDGVHVEDLHSANGVYVNGVRVTNRMTLRQGARILIGTTELSLFEIRDSSVMRVHNDHALTQLSIAQMPDAMPPSVGPLSRAPGDRPRPRLVDRVEERACVSLRLKGNEAPPPSAPISVESAPSTTRANALKMVGALAERLAAAGEQDEAVYVLSGQLRRVLQGVNAGLSVLPDVMSLAAHYALSLSCWTGQAIWIDYVVELHLSARVLMDAPTLLEFEQAASNVANHDRLLLSYYVEALRAKVGDYSPDERARVERIALFTRRR